MNTRKFKIMVKHLFLVTVPALLKAEVETCMGKIANADFDNEECVFRNVNGMKNWIELLNCPEPVENEEVSEFCLARKAPWRKSHKSALSYRQQISFVLSNYGCNCFSDSKQVPHNKKGKSKMVRVPGVNGNPVDDVDRACQVLAKRQTCLSLDNQGVPFPEGPGGICDYQLGYSTYFNTETGEHECGTLNNPGYEKVYKNNESKYNLNQCRRSLCEMDREFAMEIAPMLEDPFKFYNANVEKFDIVGTSQCVIAETEYKQDQCCGWDFMRSPFNTEKQRCCEDEIFKTGSMEAEFICTDDNEYDI